MSEEGKSGEAREERSGDTPPPAEVSRYEWIAALIGTVLLAAAVGILVQEALTEPASPPVLSVQVDSVVESGNGYLVELHATNSGGSTAAAVEISADLLDESGAVVESGGITLAYVPEGSSRAGGAFFATDPRLYRIDVRARGYERP